MTPAERLSRRVARPTCGAPPNGPCRNRKTMRPTRYHVARFGAAANLTARDGT